MKRKVYRSLDRSASVFGIHGKFLLVAAVGGGVALIGGLAAGAAFGMLWGGAAGLLLAGGAYLFTLALQTRVSEKDFLKALARRAYPRIYRFHPKHIRTVWRGFSLPATSSESI